MTYDKNMLYRFYANYADRVGAIRSTMGRSLTYAEKVLYAHTCASPDRTSSSSAGRIMPISGRIV